MTRLNVHILGNGRAAAKHRAAYAELPNCFCETESKEDADIIDVCTPHYAHFFDAGMARGPEGRHAIVEKPAAAPLQSMDVLIWEDSLFSGRIFPIFQYRFAPEPFTTWHLKRDPEFWDSWYGEWETALGGCLATLGIHWFDHILQSGRYDSVDTVYLRLSPYCDVEDSAILIVWKGGEPLQVSMAMTPHGELPDPQNSHIGYVNQLRLIHDAIVNDKPSPVTLQEARDSLELLTAAYYSAYTGEPVTLPIGEEHPFYRGWIQEMKEWSARRQRKSRISPTES